MVITTFLSTTTSNGKELSAPTKRWSGRMDKKTRLLHMQHTRDSLQIKRHTQTKRKETEEDIALMDLEGITLNEMGQIEKDKYCMISCT